MSPMLFLVQMLPLIVFIIVDALFNNIWVSIISAIAFAVGQLTIYYAKTRQIDWFVLLDVALIVGLGAISIDLKNEIFFKIKPAIVEAAAIVFFLVLILSPDRFLTGYFGRMIPAGMVLKPPVDRRHEDDARLDVRLRAPAYRLGLLHRLLFIAKDVGLHFRTRILSAVRSRHGRPSGQGRAHAPQKTTRAKDSL